MSTQERPLPEKWRPSSMCGRATLTIVASKTTMSWAVRITKRKTVGWASRRRREPGPLGSERPAVSGRDSRAGGVWGMVCRPFRWYRGE